MLEILRRTAQAGFKTRRPVPVRRPAEADYFGSSWSAHGGRVEVLRDSETPAVRRSFVTVHPSHKLVRRARRGRA